MALLNSLLRILWTEMDVLSHLKINLEKRYIEMRNKSYCLCFCSNLLICCRNSDSDHTSWKLKWGVSTEFLVQNDCVGIAMCKKMKQDPAYVAQNSFFLWPPSRSVMLLEQPIWCHVFPKKREKQHDVEQMKEKSWKFEEEINRVRENYAWSGTKQANKVRQRVFFSKK